MELTTAARVSLLDGFSVQREDARARAEVVPPGVQRLVARLCLCRRAARTAIAGELWPDVPEPHAHGSLRSALWRVQKTVPGLVRVSGDCLSLADGVRVDVHELLTWAQRVADPGSCLDALVSADVPLRGELLPGWYDDWVLFERERLRQVRMHALEVLAERLAAVGRYGEAVEAAYAAVRAEPLRESAHRTVVRVHLVEGNVVEAVRAYDSFRIMLRDELGVAPTRQLSDLVRGLPRPRRPEQLGRPGRAAVLVGPAADARVSAAT